jgi:hypothetical protein
MKAKHCNWCDAQFESEIKYQVYCSVSCREYATKEKISQRYEAVRRKKLHSKTRLCKSCNKKLSAYNDDLVCNFCLTSPPEVLKVLKEIKDISNGKKDI